LRCRASVARLVHTHEVARSIRATASKILIMKNKTLAILLMAILTAPALAESQVEMIKRVNNDNFNLPQTLVIGTAKVESGFKCNVTGGAGEIGLFQLKYATAKGVGYKGSKAALYNCETNAYYGIRHLQIAYAKCGTILGAAKLHNAGLASSCNPSAYSYKVQSAGNGNQSFDTAVRSVKKRGKVAPSNPASNLSELEKFMFARGGI
jgi:soluble lytic murein transglycosylase-like protein